VLADRVRAVLVSGALDVPADNLDLHELLEACVGAGSHVLVDLGGVAAVDLSGLGLLVHTAKELARCGRRLVMFGTHDEVRRFLAVVRAEGLLPIAPDRPSALALIDRATRPRRESFGT
jgi:anti-anti-sigma factor